MLDKKQILAIFLFEFKMDHKAVETTSNINNAFSSGIANECTVQWWSKKFCKEDKRLEDDEHSGWPLEVDNNQPEKLPKNSMWTILWSFSIWSKLERWKISVSGYPWADCQSKKKKKRIIILNCCLLLSYATNYFLLGLCPAMTSGFYTTTSDDHLSDQTKKRLQSTS